MSKLEESNSFILESLNLLKEPIATCLKASFFEYVEFYAPHIATCLLYDSIIDLCLADTLSHLATFVIGVTYLSSYDMEKFKVLSTFIGFSILIIYVCRLCENVIKYYFWMFLYIAIILGSATYFSNNSEISFYQLEKPAHRQMLLIASMNFMAYTFNVVYHPLRPGFISYFSLHFLGYMFNPVNVLNGPWLGLNIYDRCFQNKKRTGEMWNTWRVRVILQFSLQSFCFYVLGKCILQMIIEKNNNLWILIFCKCLQYRCMHYAHCHMSSAALTCAGHHVFFGNLRYPIAHASRIEFPVSMANALVCYERQFKSFIEQYFTNRFSYMQSIYPRSDLATLPLIYILMCFDQFSSLIAILTLFIFVHMQSNCQGAISDAFNICVRRYPCMYLYCPHKYKSTHPITIGCKLIFMILNLIMINYITIAIIDEDYKQIWKDMHYVGHHICMLYFLLGMITVNLHPQILYLNRRSPIALEVMVSSSSNKEMVTKFTQTDDQTHLVPSDSLETLHNKKNLKLKKKR
ncbi:protein-serine O-palmitoleoyltransferase porcupine-like isoform X2 [Atheta coriaria]|uniref:protein-serine O-palmitoleoyltransferase porcupine-like isoform X2 n=1 Tax=Dalotia coriaria TaxID=877792 RepID=UPI0031F42419